MDNNQSRENFDKKYNYIYCTPMIQQYLDVKFEHQDSLVLFRMGDFYELFFDDALQASKIMGIALGKRGKIEEEDIPMCGIPHHALTNYLPKLLESEIKIAICDQLETPEEAKKRGGYKAVVKRDVTRIITPGTTIEESALEATRPNYLASIIIANNNIVISYTDVTTGFIKIIELKANEVSGELARISPKELLICENTYKNILLKPQLINFEKKLVFQPDICFEKKRCSNQIENYYSIRSCESLGLMKSEQISALGALIQYIQLTQKSHVPKLEYPKLETTSDFMVLDSATRKSLELIESINGKKEGSLVSVIDKTVTSAGARKLYNMLSAPLVNLDKIIKRQELTKFFVENTNLANEIRSILANINDLERALSRVLMSRCTPYDLLVIRNCLTGAYLIKEILYKKFGVQNLPAVLTNIHQGLVFDYSILDLITEAIKDEASNNMSDGGFINPSYHPKLQELYLLITNSRQFVEQLKTKYQTQTKIENLKISHNNILGFYIEISSKHVDKMSSDLFIHRQSTSNASRYTSLELQELEKKIVNSHSLAVNLEHEIFEQLCMQIEKKAEELRKLSKTLSTLDVYSALAALALENNYIQPEFASNTEIKIIGGRHPVVEKYLQLKQESFVKNDTSLNDNERIILLTGPNMGGKSTYLRQNALIVILAQIGSYVPADYCKIGVVDRIFSRIGSGDDLSGGASTFMVEMIETSSILAQASNRSLVILDEVGRGTATFDGMAIAWSILEFIHDKIKCLTLFATHYHELTDLSSSLLSLKNYSVVVEERDEKIFFLHKVTRGAADKSYGIHVAEIAGVPKQITNRAKTLLNHFEKANTSKEAVRERKQLQNNDIFSLASNKNEYEDKYKDLVLKLKSFNMDDVSPREAYQILVELQNKYEKYN